MSKLAKPVIMAALILIVTITCIIFTSTTYAVWQRKVTANKEVEIPIGDYNPSLKYLKFKGLNDNMEFDDSGITKYAVVGYDGLVAEIIIPPVYTVNGVDYPVVMIATDPEETKFRFSNNEIIVSIIIPVSVVEIKSGVFAGMTALRKVIIKGTETDPQITIGGMAFAGCTDLDIMECLRPINGDRYSYLWGTPSL